MSYPALQELDAPEKRAMTDKLQSSSYCTQVALALQELNALDKGAVTGKLQSPSYCTQVEVHQEASKAPYLMLNEGLWPSSPSTVPVPARRSCSPADSLLFRSDVSPSA